MNYSIKPFSYFAADIQNAKPLGAVTIENFIRSIQNPKPEIKELLAEIRQASINKDEKLRAFLKQQLFSFTPATQTKPNFNRRYENITSFTGLMPLDFDKLPSKQWAIDWKNHLFERCDTVICSWLSASGLGVRAIVRIPVVTTVKEYKLHFHAAEKELNHIVGYDPAPQNCVLPLFISQDENILYRQNANIYTATFDKEAHERAQDEMKREKAKIKALYTPRPPASDKQKERIFNAFRSALGKISDVGHPILRAAAFTLGGFVSGGYISEVEAIALAYDEIDQHSYLCFKATTYKKTAKTMIIKGQTKPLYI